MHRQMQTLQALFRRAVNSVKSDLYKPQVYADFQLVDYTLISSCTSVGRKLAARKKAVEVHAVWCTFEHTTNTFKKGGNLQ